MNICDLPFNRLIGLRPSDISKYLLMLSANENYGNHLGTVHASALFALAEASSGEILQREYAGIGEAVPVVRNVEAKYKKPAEGNIYSLAKPLLEKQEVLASLASKKRALLPIETTLFNETEEIVFKATFEWYLFQQPTSPPLSSS